MVAPEERELCIGDGWRWLDIDDNGRSDEKGSEGSVIVSARNFKFFYIDHPHFPLSCIQ